MLEIRDARREGSKKLICTPNKTVFNADARKRIRNEIPPPPSPFSSAAAKLALHIFITQRLDAKSAARRALINIALTIRPLASSSRRAIQRTQMSRVCDVIIRNYSQ